MVLNGIDIVKNPFQLCTVPPVWSCLPWQCLLLGKQAFADTLSSWMGQHVFSRHVTSGWHHGSSVTNLTSLVASVWFFHFQGPLTFDLCDWEVIGELVLLNSHLLPGSWPVLWPSSQDSWLNQLSLLLVKCWLIVFLLPSTCYLLTSHGKISYPFSPSSFLKVDSQCVV